MSFTESSLCIGTLKVKYHLSVNNIELFNFVGANIFITAGGSLKIGDFGLCVQLKHAKTRPEEIKGTAGTAGE